MQVGLIAFSLTVLSLVSGVVALVLQIKDSTYFPRYEKLISYLLLVTVLSFASAWAIVRIVEAGLWR